MTARRIARTLLADWSPRRPHYSPPIPGLLPGCRRDEARLRAIFERGTSTPGPSRRRGCPMARDTRPSRPVGGVGARTGPVRPASGDRTVLASLASLTPSGASEPLSISGYQFAPDGSWVLLQTDGDGFWMFDVATSALKQVEAGGGNTISPDGDRILFTRDGDLHVHDLAAEQTTRLTWTTAESVSNGRAVWSPDGNRIAFVQSDASGVRMRSMLVPNDPSYPEAPAGPIREGGRDHRQAPGRSGGRTGQGSPLDFHPFPKRGLLSRAGELGRELRGVAGGAVQPVSGRTGLLHRQREYGRGRPDIPRVRSGVGRRQLSPERRSGVDPGGRLLPAS